MTQDGHDLLVGPVVEHDRLTDDRAVARRSIRSRRAVLRVARDPHLGRPRGRRGGQCRVEGRKRAQCLGDRHRLLVVARVDHDLLSGAESDGALETQAGPAHGRRAVERRPQRVVGVLIDHGREVGEGGRDHERVRRLQRAARGVLKRHGRRVLTDRQTVQRQRLRDHRHAIDRHLARRGTARAIADRVGRVIKARIGPQRRERLRLQDLAVDDLRHIDLHAAEVDLRQRARQRDIRRRRRRRRADDGCDLHDLRVGALIELQHIPGRAIGQTVKPELGRTDGGRRLRRRRRRGPRRHRTLAVDPQRDRVVGRGTRPRPRRRHARWPTVPSRSHSRRRGGRRDDDRRDRRRLRPAPVSISNVSPALRPVVLVRRTPFAPTTDA